MLILEFDELFHCQKYALVYQAARYGQLTKSLVHYMYKSTVYVVTKSIWLGLCT